MTSALPDNPNNALTESKKVAVLDGMALVQELGIRKGTKSWLELASAFIYKLCLMTKGHDEIHLVFDRYDLQMSLKDATRARRVLGTKTITYHVTDSTSLTNVTAKQFLAGNKTKEELTTYLANKTSQHFQDSGQVFIVTWRDNVISNSRDVQHLQSTQEEADTKVILHSIDASLNGADRLDIFSPDTDVLVLLLRRFPQLCPNTNFMTGTGNKRRSIPLSPIFNVLGSAKVEALPGFLAFTGADQTGKFTGKGKLMCWKTFMKCTSDNDNNNN